MPWGLWTSPPSSSSSSSSSSGERGGRDGAAVAAAREPQPQPQPQRSGSTTPSRNNNPSINPDNADKWTWQHYLAPGSLGPSLAVTAAAFGLLGFYRAYLRRIPGTNHIAPAAFRTRSLLGKVTSVGDGDNFHLFHTPGGRLAGWGWLRAVPRERKLLKGRTIPVRIAGVDAPECAHFGRPAQPFSDDALAFLQSYIQGRRVRAYIYRRDQYDRVVATVYVRRGPFFFPRRDVGLEMLRRGLATTYEAKSGAEFGGDRMKKVYEATEAAAKAKGRGMWSAEKGVSGSFFSRRATAKTLESPRAYKDRMKGLEKATAAKK
ncbi:hypothetical protein B0T26DRAFT_645604 [Lasiosphaeria miniovina]|uniref:Probable endonuclease LCL3 n=1 Tax=Lasiosphaeria miniovina TaxID=1954250 RepID=A0AA40AJN9_9PEZI|nr:uncharacterized protein B0T26DRAFT_645604 [Lasiosphaeria miniovina]KAK0716985.1 hypothetical protein B0T26DRAFT_645604 [Lasiosphaeria miniovina]